jgi:hypothetical protein
VSVEGEINGLYPTHVRLRLFAAVRVPGRIYREANGVAYDAVTGLKVTARIKEQVDHGWIEAVPREGYRADWAPSRTYYRPADSDVGRAAIERGRR